jgi:hypothetical protein
MEKLLISGPTSLSRVLVLDVVPDVQSFFAGCRGHRRRGRLDPARFRDVNKAIGHVLGSDGEPV